MDRKIYMRREVGVREKRRDGVKGAEKNKRRGWKNSEGEN